MNDDIKKAKSQDKPLIAFQRWINNIKVIVHAANMEEAEILFTKLLNTKTK